MSGRGTLDDAELRRTLEAVLSGAAAASRRAAESSPPADLPPTGAWQGAVADPPPLAGVDPAQAYTATERWIVGRGGLAVIGMVLVAIGALLLAGTLGLLALDVARLADYWPLVFVAIGLVVLLEAWAPGWHAGLREPSPDGAIRAATSSATGMLDADELERRLDRVLAARLPEAAPATSVAPVTSVAPAVSAAVQAEPPRPRPAAMVPRHGDVVAALVELQGLRRYGLISKRQYRAKRAELVARMTPSLASLGWDEPGAGDVTEVTGDEGTATGAGAQASPGYRGPTGR